MYAGLIEFSENLMNVVNISFGIKGTFLKFIFIRW